MNRALQGVFVTGTDTGVGKTFVAGGLLAALRRRGIDAVPMKPVQTGCRGPAAALQAPDLTQALRVAQWVPGAAERALMAPYRFRPACSPHLAAALAGTRIRMDRILGAAHRLAAHHEALVIEGAGGLYVPLNRRDTMLDLMRALSLPAILVARPGLGTLNHTLLSLGALRAAGLTVLGVVVSQAEPGTWGRIEADNVTTIGRMGKVPVLAVLRHRGEDHETDSAAVRRVMDRLAATVARRIGLSRKRKGEKNNGCQ